MLVDTLQAPLLRRPAGVASAARASAAPGSGGAPAVQRLEALGRSLNARPEAVAQRALGERLSAASPAARRAPVNRTGLPDALKSGAEALSGLPLDDVRVHRNSPKPAQLQAHAFARGSDIHLAPGQERHLPHEAWHVVQQKQGRVQPTMQLKGVAINDDAGLEREAEVMGARAVQLQPISEFGAPAPPAPPARPDAGPAIQRVLDPVPYATQYVGPLTATYQAAVDAFRDQLNNLVDAAYQQSLHWQTLSNHNGAHVQQWYHTAQAYALNPDVEPRILSARFGYSIESIAIDALNNTVQHGLNISTQVGHGHTRPDVVAWVNGPGGARIEIAWFDITSVASVGHILGKDGAGWRNRPFVYEIVYPQLRLRQLLDATDDPYYAEVGALLADERQVELDVKDASRKQLADAFIALRDDNGWGTGTGNAAAKRRATRDFFMAEAAGEGVEEEERSMVMTKGALIDLGINPGPFGFNRGDVASSNARLNQVIDARSEEEIHERQAGVHAAASDRIIHELLETGTWTELVEQLYGEFWSDPGSRGTALEAMALKGAIADLPRLEAIEGYLQAYATDDPLWLALGAEVELQFAPPALELDAILAWRRRTRELEDRTAGVRDVLHAREALDEYSVQHNLNFFTRGARINDWFLRLSQYPPDVGAAQEVTAWLAQQAPVLAPVLHAPAIGGGDAEDVEMG